MHNCFFFLLCLKLFALFSVIFLYFVDTWPFTRSIAYVDAILYFIVMPPSILELRVLMVFQCADLFFILFSFLLLPWMIYWIAIILLLFKCEYNFHRNAIVVSSSLIYLCRFANIIIVPLLLLWHFFTLDHFLLWINTIQSPVLHFLFHVFHISYGYFFFLFKNENQVSEQKTILHVTIEWRIKGFASCQELRFRSRHSDP